MVTLFLLDECVSYKYAELLRQELPRQRSVDAIHARQLRNDDELIQLAQEHKAVVLTADKDIAQRCTGRCAVVQLGKHLSRARLCEQQRVFRKFLHDILQALDSGFDYVVVESSRLRVGHLKPIVVAHVHVTECVFPRLNARFSIRLYHNKRL